MSPTDWRVKFHEDRDRTEAYDHVDRLSLVTGDATARELTPIVLRRWGLVYEEDPQRFDLWTWRLPSGEPPSHDGQILIV